MKNFYNNLNWIAWEKATFVAFLCSTIFMVLFSVDAVDRWIFPWNQISITAACLIPLFMVVFQHAPCWVQENSLRKEFIFIALLIILGILNIFFGEDFRPNFKGMGLFLLPAVGAFTASLFIFNSLKKITFFCWFYGGVLLGLCVYGVWQFLMTGFVVCLSCKIEEAYNVLFTSNPIPAGTMLLCLFAGPIILLSQRLYPREKNILTLVLLFGAGIIILIGSRAAILSIPVMIAFYGIFQDKRYFYYTLAFIGVFFLGYIFLEYLPFAIKEKYNAAIKFPVYRLEMYSFALHVFKESPLMGIGVWTPMANFLPNYEDPLFTVLESEFESFKWIIGYGTSFHNIFLYLFVHMGILFSIVYISFVVSVFGDLIKKCWKFSAGKNTSIFYFTWLIGLLIPALNVDLLMYPDINFLFHSILGLAPNLHLIVSSQSK